MRRSGHHAVINQLCHQLGRVLHLNNCKKTFFGIVPINGRFRYYDDQHVIDSGVLPYGEYRRMVAPFKGSPNHLYSFEDADIAVDYCKAIDRGCCRTTICVVRDPFNWLASSMQHGNYMVANLKQRIMLWKKQVAQCLMPDCYPYGHLVDVNYNRWVIDRTYREGLSAKLGLTFSDLGLDDVPDFGLGSSFDGTSCDGRGSKMDVLGRYKQFQHDARYRLLVDDRELISLSERYFGFVPDLAS